MDLVVDSGTIVSEVGSDHRQRELTSHEFGREGKGRNSTPIGS